MDLLRAVVFSIRIVLIPSGNGNFRTNPVSALNQPNRCTIQKKIMIMYNRIQERNRAILNESGAFISFNIKTIPIETNNTIPTASESVKMSMEAIVFSVDIFFFNITIFVVIVPKSPV